MTNEVEQLNFLTAIKETMESMIFCSGLMQWLDMHAPELRQNIENTTLSLQDRIFELRERIKNFEQEKGNGQQTNYL